MIDRHVQPEADQCSDLRYLRYVTKMKTRRSLTPVSHCYVDEVEKEDHVEDSYIPAYIRPSRVSQWRPSCEPTGSRNGPDRVRTFDDNNTEYFRNSCS